MEAANDFRRERLEDDRVRSTCKTCGEVLVGPISAVHFNAEWDHAARCAGTPKSTYDADEKVGPYSVRESNTGGRINEIISSE